MEKDLFEPLQEVLIETGGTLAHKKADEQPIDVLLSSWNLSQLKDFFKAENINTNVLKLMRNNDLDELMQKMKFGDKVVFKFNFEKWKAENNIPSIPQKMISEYRNLSSPSTYHTSSQSSDCESDNNIRLIDILKQHKIGRMIMEYYENNNKLTEEHRNMLLNIIVEYFDSKDIQMTLQISYRIETEILELFTTERLEFYRTERRGKLYVKFHNKKRALKLFGGSTLESPVETNENKSTFVPEPEGHICAQTLKYDNLSAEEFTAAWASCAKYRINQIFNETQNITESLNLWPQYKGSNGFKLIDHDFHVIHANAFSIFDWDEKFEKLFQYLKTRRNIRDKSVKDVVALLEKNWVAEGKDNFYLKLLWCLHYQLYPTKKCTRKTKDGKKESARYSLKDSQESFIHIGETMQSIEEHMDFLRRKGEPIQPFILGLGEPKNLHVSEYYVYLDGQLIKLNSFCRSLDICFKSYHLFNVEYPPASRPFWTFIQEYLYNIVKNDIKISKVSVLIDELSCII